VEASEVEAAEVEAAEVEAIEAIPMVSGAETGHAIGYEPEALAAARQLW
jgi:hypothetical protein